MTWFILPWLLASLFPGRSYAENRCAVTEAGLTPSNPGKPRLARDHLVDQFPAPVDLDADLVARLEEFSARHAYACRGAGGEDIARIEREVTRQLGDLLRNIVDQPCGIGVLLEHSIDP